MAYGNVDKFRKPHSSEGGNGSTTNIYIGGSTNNGNLRVTNLTASNIDANRITANNIEASNAKFKYIMSEYGEIKKIEGKYLNYEAGEIDDLKCTNIETNELKVNDTATIENIVNNILSSKNITTDYLTVNKSAYFFELVIDKIRSIQGTQINTAANCVLDYVEAYDSNDNLVDVDDNSVHHYRVYWKNKEESEDGNGKEITNDWLPLDQALCESFNVNVGVNQNVNNQYYWRKVLAIDNGNIKYINLNIGDVQNSEVTDYEIVFPNLFKYVDQTETEEFTDFTVESQITGEWDGTDTWTVSSTQYGLQITMPEYTGANGTFVFSTQSPTKLNVGVYYTDGTFGYFPADNYKTNYSIATENDKMVEAFVIVCPKIEKWYACNWIDLSNIYNAVKPDYDPTVMLNEDGTPKGGIPKAGDNLVQLGYRFDELANPTQDDIDRASAIIIAAYKTPDAGDQLVSPAIPPIYPPSYAQYQRINDFNLAHHRKTYFDAQRSQFIGDFKVVANNTEVDLDTYIQQQTVPASVDVAVRVPGPNSTWVDYSLCVLQSTGNNVITDLNNFPSQMRLQIINYTSSTSLNVQAASLEMFGRTIDLLNPSATESSAQGIYVSSVTTPGVDYLLINFAYRGTASQTIPNGSALKFSGQITVDGTTYHPSATIPLTVVNSVQGTDGEVYVLKKEIEKAQVDNEGTLRTNFQYKINHIVGQTAEVLVNNTDFYLWIHRYDQNGNDLDVVSPIILNTASYNTNGYWSWSETINDWFTNNMSGKPFYYVVEMYNNNDDVYDTSVVNIQLLGTSLFEVRNGLTQSIQAVATGAYAEYSSLVQTTNSISARVTSVSDTVNGIATGIQSAGINITTGEITLDGAKTHVTGDLRLDGIFESYNETYQNRTLINTKNNESQGLIMSGPNSIDTGTGLPNPGATEVDLIKLDFQSSAGPMSGQITLYDRGHSSYVALNTQDITMHNGSNGNSLSINPDSITYNDAYLGNNIDKSTDEIFYNKLRTLTIDGVAAYTIRDIDMDKDIIMIFDTRDFTLHLPDPRQHKWDGKKFYIKKLVPSGSDFNTRIKILNTEETSFLRLLVEENNSLDSLQTEININDDSMIFICMGGYWVQFHCG